MAGEHLAKVWDLTGVITHVVMLRSVGALLQRHYADTLQEPFPEHLEALAQRLRASG